MNFCYLQDFSNEKALLSIILLWILQINVVNSTESTGRSAVPFDCLHRIPSPITVFLIVRQSPHYKITFNHFGPQNVILWMVIQWFCFDFMIKATKINEKKIKKKGDLERKRKKFEQQTIFQRTRTFLVPSGLHFWYTIHDKCWWYLYQFPCIVPSFCLASWLHPKQTVHLQE